MQINGYRMAYAEEGEGVPLVLVHGSLSDYRCWAPQMAQLGQSFRVLALSLRHHYPEQWDGTGNGYTVPQHVHDIAEFIRALQVGPVYLLGHSRGGNVAFLVAHGFPDLVRSLILADPAIELDEPHGGPGASDIPQGPGLAGDGRSRAVEMIRNGDIDGGLEMFIDAVSGVGVWQKINSRRKQAARDNARTLVAQMADRPVQVSDDMLSAVKVPTLLMGGEKSPAAYSEIIETLARRMPNALRHTVQGSSHSMNAENPPAFNAAVLAFAANCAKSR